MVTPDTILRWHRQPIARKRTFAPKRPGRTASSSRTTRVIFLPLVIRHVVLSRFRMAPAMEAGLAHAGEAIEDTAPLPTCGGEE
jgi:hypothetical protein